MIVYLQSHIQVYKYSHTLSSIYWGDNNNNFNDDRMDLGQDLKINHGVLHPSRRMDLLRNQNLQ